jgi:CubicO group peptidase (beta-lactamase class C family)
VEQCYYEAYVRLFVIAPLKLHRSGFLPPVTMWAEAAPTENDTGYLHRQIQVWLRSRAVALLTSEQGQVSDGNAYALGGIAGHAGLFSTAPDALLIMQRYMYAGEADAYLNRTTARLFITEHNATQSSRALGWNTNDPAAYDQGWNQSCGVLFSPRTFMHTGYTGTQVRR